MRTVIPTHRLLPKGLDLESLNIETGHVAVSVSSGARRCMCPVCGRVSSRAHSRYSRTSQKNLRTRRRTVTGIPCQGRSDSVLVYREWTLADPFPHAGQRATRDEVLAARVMAF